MSAPDRSAAVEPPLALLAELTHRCPLQCPYCSNPRALVGHGAELDTATWSRVLSEAAQLGVLQVHFSGGEPTARRDLVDLVRHAARVGLYSNLITSGVQLDGARLATLAAAGLDHVQLSFQDADDAGGDAIAAYAGAQAKKRAAAALVVAQGLALTANLVVHRRNLARLPAMIEMAAGLGAGRLEVAHVQYYGWALANRAALLPTAAQLVEADAVVAAARERLKGRVVIDYVPPDYHARQPKPCMSGWGRRFINITPSGKALPCHAAETIADLDFPSVTDHALAAIWRSSAAFQRFRGTAWMPEPCRSCDQREVDWGGCRCQALALTGDAARTDPVCALAPDHALIDDALAAPARDALVFRRFEKTTLP
ncbi:MAG TPA: pyrroloquinoline quinone biosynthesis protein PqqE [Candidatus Sulfotelmatobacter sp.]|nr:pyrroloquinoline quinone biosynthesis protein PqqE [Candidatus Sulfotelmatobacter sp.]